MSESILILLKIFLEADPTNEIVEGADNKTKGERIEQVFKDGLDGIKGLTIRIETLKDESVPGIILLNEQSRRFKEMTSMMGQGEMPDLFADHTLMVNTASPAVEKILKLQDEGNTEFAEMLMNQIYDLAMLSHQAINKERMAGFLERSGKLLGMI